MAGEVVKLIALQLPRANVMVDETKQAVRDKAFELYLDDPLMANVVEATLQSAKSQATAGAQEQCHANERLTTVAANLTMSRLPLLNFQLSTTQPEHNNHPFFTSLALSLLGNVNFQPSNADTNSFFPIPLPSVDAFSSISPNAHAALSPYGQGYESAFPPYDQPTPVLTRRGGRSNGGVS